MDESPKKGLSQWWGIAWLAAGWICGFGCMSINLGNRTYQSPGSYIDHTGVLRQTGETPLIKTQDDRIEVYYPRPFSSKPNLTLGKNPGSVPSQEIELLEQTPDHFTIRWHGQGGEALLSWHAEGMPVPGSVPESTTPSKTASTKQQPISQAGGS